jgi:hypothetical protein
MTAIVSHGHPRLTRGLAPRGLTDHTPGPPTSPRTTSPSPHRPPRQPAASRPALDSLVQAPNWRSATNLHPAIDLPHPRCGSCARSTHFYPFLSRPIDSAQVAGQSLDNFRTVTRQLKRHRQGSRPRARHRRQRHPPVSRYRWFVGGPRWAVPAAALSLGFGVPGTSSSCSDCRGFFFDPELRSQTPGDPELRSLAGYRRNPGSTGLLAGAQGGSPPRTLEFSGPRKGRTPIGSRTGWACHAGSHVGANH